MEERLQLSGAPGDRGVPALLKNWSRGPVFVVAPVS